MTKNNKKNENTNKEIYGANLGDFFINLKKEYGIVYAKCKYSKYQKHYGCVEVWEISKGTYDFINSMDEKEFKKYAKVDNSFWVYFDGSILGEPTKFYTINGVNILAWDGEHRKEFYFNNCSKECSDMINGSCRGVDIGTNSEIDGCYHQREYDDLFEYFEVEIRTSDPKNICALAKDLAYYNNMSMSELFNELTEC